MKQTECFVSRLFLRMPGQWPDQCPRTCFENVLIDVAWAGWGGSKSSDAIAPPASWAVPGCAPGPCELGTAMSPELVFFWWSVIVTKFVKFCGGNFILSTKTDTPPLGMIQNKPAIKKQLRCFLQFQEDCRASAHIKHILGILNDLENKLNHSDPLQLGSCLKLIRAASRPGLPFHLCLLSKSTSLASIFLPFSVPCPEWRIGCI